MPKTQYVLSKLIARGGMAEIYLGKGIGEDSFQRVCAIKRILPHHAQDREFVKMFRDEAHICKRLQHANIVQVFDFTEVESSYALIMEYVEGSDLRSLLAACEKNQVRLTIPMVLHLISSVARGLQYAHTKVDEVTNEPIGIIHRDISPQNILLSYEGEIKIIDFGIASSETKIAETHPGVVKGKYAYMSPEQVMAKPLDPRSDVFSLAVVMWECLTMKRLFTGKSEVETIRKVQACEIPDEIGKINLSIPIELQEIVNKGLEKDRDKRYQSALAFEKDILKFLHSRYPEYMPPDIGIFIQKLLANKRSLDQVNIKRVLTQTNFSTNKNINGLKLIKDRINRNGNIRGSRPKSNISMGNKNVDLVFDEKKHSTRIRLAEMSMSSTNIGSHRYYSPKQRRYQKRSIYYYVTKAISQNIIGNLIIFISLFFVGRYFFANVLNLYNRSLSVELVSNVKSAKITLNGKWINKGKYVNLPAKLNLKPGSYKIGLKRDGYASQVITVNGDKGQSIKPEILLKNKNVLNMASVKILSAKSNLFVNVNGGLYKGNTPLSLALKSKRNHFLEATYEKNGRIRKLKCNFNIPGGLPFDKKELIIKINFRNISRKCISGWREIRGNLEKNK